jgi:hypothetical protein
MNKQIALTNIIIPYLVFKVEAQEICVDEEGASRATQETIMTPVRREEIEMRGRIRRREVS